jgi:hypothetical protein
MGRTTEGSRCGEMASLIRIAQGQAKQPALPVAHMEFGAVAGFQQSDKGESRFGHFNATVGLHGFFRS